MSTEDNKAIVRRFLQEVWANGNMTSADELAAPTLFVSYPNMGKPAHSLEEFKRYLLELRSFIPGHEYVSEDEIIAEGNKVVVRWTWRSTYAEEAALQVGLPSTAMAGKPAVSSGISFFQIVDGKIVEEIGFMDVLAHSKQFGFVAHWKAKV